MKSKEQQALLTIHRVRQLVVRQKTQMLNEIRGLLREFSAWLGLTPRNRSSGAKERFGRISKKGDRYPRRLLVIGMTSQVQRARGYPERVHPWIMQLLERKPVRLAMIAMAKKAARIIRVIPTKETYYRQTA